MTDTATPVSAPGLSTNSLARKRKLDETYRKAKSECAVELRAALKLQPLERDMKLGELCLDWFEQSRVGSP